MKSKKQHQKSELNCAYCGKEFKYDSERKRHEQSHSPQFECKVCGKKFSFLSAVRRHEKQHERTGSVTCNECNRKFRDEVLLKRHIKYAHKGSFTCTKCEATFSSELALNSHSKTHKPESERKFRCSFHGCTKTFNFTHHLKHHELTHTNTKQHFCNICGKGFIQSHHLKSHKKKHEPGKQLKCEVSGCKKTFSTEYAWKRHFSTHKEIKVENVDDERKSSCDITELIESDTVICAVCDKMLLRVHYTDHLKECDIRNVNKPVEIEDNKTQITQSPQPVRIQFEDDISTCKSYVGGCIVEADANGNEKCLCAQISARNPNIYESANENDVFNTKDDGEVMNLSNKSDDACQSCECATNKYSNTTNASNYDNDIDISDVPKIEYRSDGIIKIKDTFDIDIPTCENSKAKDGFDNMVPYNSCKAILGKCIVSGNGTIDEGCLCAKMALDDQQMTQEIEELTPCPK